MAGILGPRAAVDAVGLPTGLDGSRIFAFQMRNRKTVGQVVAETAAAIGVVNQQINAKFGAFMYFTDSPYAYYQAGTGGGRRETPIKVEFSQAKGVRSAEGGHMLPLVDFEDALAWSQLYLRDARDAQLSSDVNLIVESWRNRVNGDFYRRILTDNENVIGGGYDVPWAIGTGVSVPYIPQQYGTYAHDDTHTHFLATANTASSDYNTQLETAIEHLIHHGMMGPFTLLTSRADVLKYDIAKKFVRLLPNGVQAVGGNSDSPVLVSQQDLTGAPGEVFGYFISNLGTVVILRNDPFIPTGYAWLGKSFGMNNPMNPVALRVHPDTAFGLRLDPKGNGSLTNPELEKILVMGTHGVGVNNRLGGVAMHWGNASWTDPTF